MSALETLRNALFGNPASDQFKPDRNGVLQAFQEIIETVNNLAVGIKAYATRADLPADAVAGQQGRVYDDPSSANNTVWVFRDGAWIIDQDFINSLAAVVQPLVNAAQQAATSAAASAALLSGYIIFPTYDIFVIADNAENVLLRIDRNGAVYISGINGSIQSLIGTAGGATQAVKYRLYTFDGATVNAEKLKAYEGVDGLNFNTTLPIIFNPPSGQTVRDPDVFKDSASGIWWMVYSAWSFLTGSTRNTFGVARSKDGINWTYVGLVSLATVPDPKGTNNVPDRAWAPQWVFDGAGGVYVLVSTYFGETDTAGTGRERMVPIMMRVASPDMKKMTFVDRLNGSKVPFNCIDTAIIRVNGMFLAAAKDEAATELRIIYSSSLTSGYDSEGSTSTSLFGAPIEGPTLLPFRDGRIRIYYDRYNGSGLFCRDSEDGGVTWLAEQAVVAPIERHGSVVIV